MRVKKMMHRKVEWVSPDTSVRTLAKKMRQYDIGAIPVGENDRLIGMVTDRDITVRGVANGKDVSKLTARDVMTKGVIWCRDTDKARSAARTMESMLALGDICHAASQKTAAKVTKAVSAHHR
jgi:predicted transcriptional regulator